MRNPQLNADGELQHLLTLEGLPPEVIGRILDTAVPFVSIAERDVKKVPLLRGKTVFNLFFENSTRTRTTFEIAAKRLSADEDERQRRYVIQSLLFVLVISGRFSLYPWDFPELFGFYRPELQTWKMQLLWLPTIHALLAMQRKNSAAALNAKFRSIAHHTVFTCSKLESMKNPAPSITFTEPRCSRKPKCASSCSSNASHCWSG